MEYQEIRQKLAQARAIVREIREGTDSPLIERCMHLADMNLHWALWGLGEVGELTPELEA